MNIRISFSRVISVEQSVEAVTEASPVNPFRIPFAHVLVEFAAKSGFQPTAARE
jgi:hypothetical protein